MYKVVRRRELRKVQDTGGTYFISIPKQWARSRGVEKGSIVELIPRADGRLVVDPHYGLVQNRAAATILPSPLLEREITGKYLLGHNTIQIEGTERLSPKVYERTRATVRRLIGLEIVEDHSTPLCRCAVEIWLPGRIPHDVVPSTVRYASRHSHR